MPKLLIVVPYRDRPEHLKQFIPHLRAYFARDKRDKELEYRVLVVEQTQGLPFNLGALRNIGFCLGGDDTDYTCFHDVDYLPIWADYSWAEAPTGIVWYGAEARPIAPGRSNALVVHNLPEFFGGVILTPNDLFRRVNGFANAYWGWGEEDTDLRARFRAIGVEMQRRRGTFAALPHDHRGFGLDAKVNAIGATNAALYKARWENGTHTLRHADGLSALDFKVRDRSKIPDQSPERQADWEMVTVELKGTPSIEQLTALGATLGVQNSGPRTKPYN